MLSETRPAKVGKWTEPALRVLRERYLMREGGEVVETPEEMCWRLARSNGQRHAPAHFLRRLDDFAAFAHQVALPEDTQRGLRPLAHLGRASLRQHMGPPPNPIRPL